MIENGKFPDEVLVKVLGRNKLEHEKTTSNRYYK